VAFRWFPAWQKGYTTLFRSVGTCKQVSPKRRRSRLLQWLSALSQVTSCSLNGSSTLAETCLTGYLGSTISGSLSHLVAVFLEIPSLRLAWRHDMPSRMTRRRNLLKVPTLITPGCPCSKNKQDRPMKWLKFRCKFPSKWARFLKAINTLRFGSHQAI
jgi:hypothetical protein